MKRLVLATAAALALAGPAAAADLLGSQVTAQLFYPNLATPDSPVAGPVTVVDPGVEFPPNSIIAGRNFGFDITGNQIKYIPDENSSYGVAAFNGFVLTFTGAPAITSVTYDAGDSNFAATGISFTSNSVSLNYSGASPTVDSLSVFDIGFAGVPEPATWAMMILGVGLIGAALRGQYLAGRRLAELRRVE